MSIMGKIHKVEKFFDVLMSFATLVGFASTAYLVWIFLNTPPTIVVSTTTVGAPGIVGYPYRHTSFREFRSSGYLQVSFLSQQVTHIAPPSI